MSSDFVICINVLEASFSNSVDPDQTAYLFLSMDWIRDGSVCNLFKYIYHRVLNLSIL